ncbi:MAG: molybdenum cofactor biosynthesis protein MoaE [Bacteroidetes bacterium]|nr:molybdenum cofactor biosynthesis protein MoaE [Bacteroidota bacterium]
MSSDKKAKSFFVNGPVSPEKIAANIAAHQNKTHVGASQLFLGQVRADEVNGLKVTAIEYSAYEEMANAEIARIREEIIVKYKLSCAHVYHSLGHIEAGQVCFFVSVSSPHREASTLACSEMVERIKKEVPVFGRELFENDSHQWKTNQ